MFVGISMVSSWIYSGAQLAILSSRGALSSIISVLIIQTRVVLAPIVSIVFSASRRIGLNFKSGFVVFRALGGSVGSILAGTYKVLEGPYETV